MKKLVAWMTVLCIALLPALALGETWYCGRCGTARTQENTDVYALANQRISTRTGPGTQYSEMGTYYLSGQYLRVTAKAWDSRNSIWWVQVDIPDVGLLWTGAKRFDGLNLSQLPDWDGTTTGGGTTTGSGSGAGTITDDGPYAWLIGKWGRVCVNEGFVRYGAGTDYREAGVVFHDEWYEILDVRRGNTAKDWCMVNFDGEYVWISTGLLEIDGIQGGTIYGEWAP